MDQIITQETAELAYSKGIFEGRCTQTILSKILREKYELIIMTYSYAKEIHITYVRRLHWQYEFDTSAESIKKVFSSYEESLEGGLAEALNLITIKKEDK